MRDVFVSHAAADSPLVGEFVDTVLKLGCGLSPSQIVYTSNRDTGVPSGSDLLHYVREQVGDAGLVVAIVSPTFQTRPVCVAELGAAWSRTGNLFPIAVPGMKRTDMHGVLSGVVVHYLDDGDALDELQSRIGAVVGQATESMVWNPQKAKWLANVESYVAKLAEPTVVDVDEHRKLLAQLEGTQAALKESEVQRRELDSRLKAAAAAASSPEQRMALLPTNEVGRFQALVKEATAAIRKAGSIVGEVIFAEIAHGAMDWPDAWDNRDRIDELKLAVERGDLVETSDERLVTNDEIRDVRLAGEAVRDLKKMLAECSEEFDSWFRDEYGFPPDLSMRRAWDATIG
jgi:predicted transcriptional regulator